MRDTIGVTAVLLALGAAAVLKFGIGAGWAGLAMAVMCVAALIRSGIGLLLGKSDDSNS